MNNQNKDYVSSQRQTVSRHGRYLSPRHSDKKRRRNHRRKIILISALALALVIFVVILLFKGCSNDQNTNAELTGVWYYDQYTEYEFDSEGNGCMCLDGNNHFEFTYKTEDGTLHLDFALDYVTDCQYTYTVDDDKLILVGGEGTAEVGKVYELTKRTND